MRVQFVLGSGQNPQSGIEDLDVDVGLGDVDADEPGSLEVGREKVPRASAPEACCPISARSPNSCNSLTMSEAVATDRPVAAAMSRLTTGAEAMRCRITAKRLVRRMSWYVRFNDVVLCSMRLGRPIVTTACTPLELPCADFFWLVDEGV